MNRRPAGPAEADLARLRGWLRNAKGKQTFDSLARRASAQKTAISTCTLRRALGGRLPTLYTVRAFARGAGADEEEAARVWAAASAAVRPAPVRKPAAYVPGHGITTRAGLAAAMEKVRAAAGGPSLRRLAGSPEAAGRISRSALHNALTGRRLPSEELLTDFAAACGAGEETARALLAARTRILTGPPPRPQARAWTAEQAKYRGLRDAGVPYWMRNEDMDKLDLGVEPGFPMPRRPSPERRTAQRHRRRRSQRRRTRTNSTGTTGRCATGRNPITGGWMPGSTASPTTSSRSCSSGRGMRPTQGGSAFAPNRSASPGRPVLPARRSSATAASPPIGAITCTQSTHAAIPAPTRPFAWRSKRSRYRRATAVLVRVL
ncbi:hypothetical protein STRTUCAR8_00064 [Streptomyces turgidiscabies Car8]|uniref:HTH cro/C1-type domain-containing protein n=1 Tax=Streptomyces turgidiscabies (strain Car8) TaxID=698760 RepID=L7FER9_STRT8|nr:hypothetical protein STRTUCAR8_00064 [Streptomyces turgidiscabies Car8]GAQ77132.1 hypothetical protein T45_08948 [Streptomyces turgidiscabies]